MGVTISHTLAQQKGRVKNSLNRVEKVAILYKAEAKRLSIPFAIRREDDRSLYIDIGNCETLAFEFRTFKTLSYPEFWKWFDNSGNKHIENYPEQELLWSSSFCKTQFAKNIVEHKFVADLIQVMASMCEIARVMDEGDYYHTGILEDAQQSIHSNGLLIDSIHGQLKDAGFEDANIIKGGETNI